MENTKNGRYTPKIVRIGLICVAIAVAALLSAALAVHKRQLPARSANKLDSTGLRGPLGNQNGVTDTAYMKQRGLQEYDKSPIMQWVERAKIDHHITSQHVEIVPVKGTNERRFINELTVFLRSKGYTVSLADSTCQKTSMRDVSITGKDNCILVHVGYL